MASNDRISLLVLEAQERIFRLAQRDHGLCLKSISIDSGIPYNTIRSYAGSCKEVTQSIMPITAMLKLVGVLPDDLLSHLTSPVDRCIAPCADEGDHDSLATDCVTYIGTHAAARHPQSPAGVNIAPCEDAKLRSVRSQLRSRA